MAMLSSRASLLSSLAAIAALLFLAGTPVQAQTTGDGSIYSRLGLGTLQDFSSSQSQALGGGAYALRSFNYNPTANPALWSDQVYTRLAGGASYESINATSGNGQSTRLGNGSIDAIQFSFPLYKEQLGVGLSFQPFTKHNYQTDSETLSTFQGASSDNGSGGLYSFRGGLGYKVTDYLRVGASVDVIFGVLERTQTVAQDSLVTDATRLSGVTGTFGTHFSFTDVLASDDALSLGAALSVPTTLSGTRVRTTSSRSTVTTDTLTAPNGQGSFEGQVSLPWRSRVGLAYEPSAKWAVTVDGLYEPWSDFSSSFGTQAPFSQNVPVGGEDALTDRWRTSIGAEFLPAGQDQFANYFSNVAYRLGAYTERLYVQPDSETTLQTYALTGGFSFPTSLSGTRIDLNFRVGTRGTTEDALVQDRFYGFSFHVNFGEEWFQERKLQ